MPVRERKEKVFLVRDRGWERTGVKRVSVSRAIPRGVQEIEMGRGYWGGVRW